MHTYLNFTLKTVIHCATQACIYPTYAVRCPFDKCKGEIDWRKLHRSPHWSSNFLSHGYAGSIMRNWFLQSQYLQALCLNICGDAGPISCRISGYHCEQNRNILQDSRVESTSIKFKKFPRLAYCSRHSSVGICSTSIWLARNVVVRSALFFPFFFQRFQHWEGFSICTFELFNLIMKTAMCWLWHKVGWNSCNRCGSGILYDGLADLYRHGVQHVWCNILFVWLRLIQWSLIDN